MNIITQYFTNLIKRKSSEENNDFYDYFQDIDTDKFMDLYNDLKKYEYKESSDDSSIYLVFPKDSNVLMSSYNKTEILRKEYYKIDENGKYYLEKILSNSDADIYTNFSILSSNIDQINDVKIYYNNATEKNNCNLNYESILLVLKLPSKFGLLTLRYIFENEPSDLEINYDCSFIKNEIRQKLASQSITINNIRYSDGLVYFMNDN